MDISEDYSKWVKAVASYKYFKLIRICIEFVKEIRRSYILKEKSSSMSTCINSVKKTEKLTETMNQIVAENKKLQSIVKNVCRKLEDKIVYLAKNQAKGKQYSRRNNTWKYQAYQTSFLITILRT